MKCPECGTKNAQQLLVSFLCPSKTCINYDIRHAEEVWRNFMREQEKTRHEQSQMQMELAITHMQNSNEQKILQDQARMKLEKIRHASLMHIKTVAKEALDKVEIEDPLDAALKEYLQRKLQIDGFKDLGPID